MFSGRIGRGLIPPRDNPAFARGRVISINLFDKLSCPYHHLTRYGTTPDMSKLPTAYGESSLGGGHRCYGTSHTCADNTTNNARSNSNTNSANVSNSGSSTVSVGINRESLHIQEWLSPLEPHKRHQDVRNRRLAGVGDWILQRNEFESWRNSRDSPVNPTLRCYGDQGVGKTYIRYSTRVREHSPRTVGDADRSKISSLVIDTLYQHAHGQNIVVLSLYCDYQARKDQSAVNMIGSLLRQIVVRAVGIPHEIKSAFEESRQGGGQGLRLPDMLKLFAKTIDSIERVYICIDAVDELLPQDRLESLRALQQVIQEASNTRLFLTGRPYVHGEVDKYLTERAYTIDIVADRGDIASYVTQKMDNDDARDPGLMTEDMRNDIMKTMLEKASRM